MRIKDTEKEKEDLWGLLCAQRESSGKEEPAALFQVEYLALEGGGG